MILPRGDAFAVKGCSIIAHLQPPGSAQSSIARFCSDRVFLAKYSLWRGPNAIFLTS